MCKQSVQHSGFKYTHGMYKLCDKAEADESLKGKPNSVSSVVTDSQVSTDVDPEPTQGKSPTKNTLVITDPHVSTQPVDKHDLGLRFKPKHRNAINLAKDNATFKCWDDQTITKYGFIPLGASLVQIKMPKIPVQVICLIFTTVLNFNFMDAQISVPSQLKVDIWDSYLEGYWDGQIEISYQIWVSHQL